MKEVNKPFTNRCQSESAVKSFLIDSNVVNGMTTEEDITTTLDFKINRFNFMSKTTIIKTMSEKVLLSRLLCLWLYIYSGKAAKKIEEEES